MNTDENELINLKQFLEEKIGFVREDYFTRNKNVQETIKSDLELSNEAFSRLEEICE